MTVEEFDSFGPTVRTLRGVHRLLPGPGGDGPRLHAPEPGRRVGGTTGPERSRPGERSCAARRRLGAGDSRVCRLALPALRRAAGLVRVGRRATARSRSSRSAAAAAWKPRESSGSSVVARRCSTACRGRSTFRATRATVSRRWGRSSWRSAERAASVGVSRCWSDRRTSRSRCAGRATRRGRSTTS